MKIGLITGEYPPRQGGVGDFTRELARALIDLGHDAQVVTGQPISASLRGRFAGVGGKLQVDGLVVHRVIGSWGTGCWRQIAKLARDNRLEVLNIQYEPAAYAMQVGINFLPSGFVRRSIKLPIVTTFHDLLVPYLFPKAGSLRRKVVDYLARKSDAVIVTNEEDRSNLRLPISNLFVIPIGSNIDPSRLIDFNGQSVHARWNLRPDEMLIGYFGFLSLSKGGEVLMRALKLLVDRNLPVKLMLIGGRTGSSDPSNVEYAAQVDRMIESLDLKDRIITTGYLDPIDVSRALMICDAVALPYQDGASLRRGSLLAAIAHGRAIVTTTPAYTVQGLIDTQSVLFVPPDDPMSLANAIERVLTDRVLRDQLERGAREAAKLYTWDRIAAQTIDVYEKVTSDK
jgi:glycosyltransferase involved in cell wall biosynthesis